MTTEVKVLKIRKLGKDQYSVLEGNLEKGTVLYRKMGTDQEPYEVGFTSGGEAFCNCKGFRFNDKCKHATDFNELAPILLDEMDAGQEIRGQSSEDAELKTPDDGRTPREELEISVDAILNACIGEGFAIEAAGSWRRNKARIRDLDFVTTAAEADITRLFGEGLDATAKGPKIIRFEIDVAEDKAVQIDFVLVGVEHWGAGLLYLTGDKAFNIFMRSRAKKRGMKLSRNGLVVRADERLLAAKTEEEIFSKLGMDFVPPPERQDRGWTEYLRN